MGRILSTPVHFPNVGSTKFILILYPYDQCCSMHLRCCQKHAVRVNILYIVLVYCVYCFVYWLFTFEI